MSHISFTIVLLFLPIFIESKDHWSYEHIVAWPQGHHYCGGKSQSPIDLRLNTSQYHYRLGHMFLQEQHSRNRSQLINNGHTAQLNLRNHYLLQNIDPSAEDYIVEQIHFHWGNSNDNRTGSEHTVEGHSYPLEMHIVTYSNLFSNIGEAISNTRALAVVGAFFKLSDRPNKDLEPLIVALKKISHTNTNTSVGTDFNLKTLLGRRRMGRYYRYDGSLTTPFCYESVIWSVLQDPLHLSYDQLRAFHSLHNEKGRLLKNNNRPVQSLGTRKLFRSFHSEHVHQVDYDERVLAMKSDGQYLSFDWKLIFGVISFFMILL